MPENNLVSIEKSIDLLKSGEVVAIPTETVYGLAARIDDETAINKIFSTKKRPFFDPLIVHISDIEQAKSLTTFWTQDIEKLAERFWPGPLTLVLPKQSTVLDTITSGLKTVGIRYPSHPVAQKIIAGLGVPLAAPSANMFGRTSPTHFQHVIDEFNNEVAVVEGGESEVGIESTVLEAQIDPSTNEIIKWAILRPGVVGRKEISEVLGKSIDEVVYKSSLASPGNVKVHYQPEKPLITMLGSHSEEQVMSAIEGSEFNASEVSIVEINVDALELARRLYSLMREASKGDHRCTCLVIKKYVEDDMWRPIKDRLTRASQDIYFSPI